MARAVKTGIRSVQSVPAVVSSARASKPLSTRAEAGYRRSAVSAVGLANTSWFRDGGLYAVQFDAGRLTVTGQPIEVTAAVEQDSSGAPLAEISSAGSLVYQRAGVASGRLVWVSRQGIEQPVTDVPRAYLSPRLSADNSRIVVGVGSDLWIQEPSFDVHATDASQRANRILQCGRRTKRDRLFERHRVALNRTDGSGRHGRLPRRHQAISQAQSHRTRTNTGDGTTT